MIKFRYQRLWIKMSRSLSEKLKNSGINYLSSLMKMKIIFNKIKYLKNRPKEILSKLRKIIRSLVKLIKNWQLIMSFIIRPLLYLWPLKRFRRKNWNILGCLRYSSLILSQNLPPIEAKGETFLIKSRLSSKMQLLFFKKTWMSLIRSWKNYYRILQFE